MSYDAVLFDCDGVIVEMPDRTVMTEAMRRVQRRFELSDPPEQMVADFFRGNLSSITERCRSAGIERDTFCAEAAREGVRAQLTEIRSGLRSVYDDVAAVKKLNYPMGVVSDNHPHVLSFLLGRFDLTSYFETVRGCRFTPSGLERQKPNPHNVQAALETLGAESALYVGDQQIDVKAADNAGIDSVLLRRERPTESGIDVAPTYEVSSLWQLHNILSQRD
ncbi:HAD family hydrolase [Haloarcula hispanica]|nr:MULTISPECIES: HAD family hydrolase [Haloarcula]AEM57200.1 HAD-superfamily hydrolase, subfamily IA, variant 1 [Haloarcula hispanica ATCC 33960]MCJ0618909.1 HAD family hydrolase [Haloarcula hispanica]RLM34115.1 HAD family hydrolase [Haloarcula sp. Atlit-120R]RLM42513.1 HAD family hydrolase [Haloarcula sp. Atlit-47R]RLM95957.1 HAD family hydrolase [Haloarcula sp. Atlit-7R]